MEGIPRSKRAEIACDRRLFSRRPRPLPGRPPADARPRLLSHLFPPSAHPRPHPQVTSPACLPAFAVESLSDWVIERLADFKSYSPFLTFTQSPNFIIRSGEFLRGPGAPRRVMGKVWRGN